jgi:hypothetical protein
MLGLKGAGFSFIAEYGVCGWLEDVSSTTAKTQQLANPNLACASGGKYLAKHDHDRGKENLKIGFGCLTRS